MEPTTNGIVVLSNCCYLNVNRYSVCFLCTVASIFLLIAFHSIVRNPETTGLDYAIIIVTVIALYVENQVRI